MKLLSRRQVADKGLPASKAYLWRVERHPDPALPHPRPVRIGTRCYWVEAEIDQYISELAARRGNSATA